MKQNKVLCFYRYKNRKYGVKTKVKGIQKFSGFYTNAGFILSCFKRGIEVQVLDRYTREDVTQEVLQTALYNYYKLSASEIRQLILSKPDPKVKGIHNIEELADRLVSHG